jgi:hypothetical protein
MKWAGLIKGPVELEQINAYLYLFTDTNKFKLTYIIKCSKLSPCFLAGLIKSGQK